MGRLYWRRCKNRNCQQSLCKNINAFGTQSRLEEITELFKNHFESIAPKGVTVKVTPHHGGQGYVTPIDTIGYKAASKPIELPLEKHQFHNEVEEVIPIVALFEQELKSKTILMGFGLDRMPFILQTNILEFGIT